MTISDGNDAGDRDTNSTRAFCCSCSCWHGWCSFPQVAPRGRQEQKRNITLLAVAFVLSILALIASDGGTDVCGFLEGSVVVDDEATATMERRKIGLNVYEDDNGECTSWRKGDSADAVFDEEDTLWIFVRYCVGIGAVFSLLGIICVGLTACISFPKCFWQGIPWLWHGVWFLFSLAFVVFGSEVCLEPKEVADWHHCTWDIGATLIIVGVVLWIPATFVLWLLSSSVVRNWVETTVDDTAPTNQSIEAQPTNDPTKEYCEEERVDEEDATSKCSIHQEHNDSTAEEQDLESQEEEHEAAVDRCVSCFPKDKTTLSWLLLSFFLVIVSIAANTLVISTQHQK